MNEKKHRNSTDASLDDVLSCVERIINSSDNDNVIDLVDMVSDDGHIIKLNNDEKNSSNSFLKLIKNNYENFEEAKIESDLKANSFANFHDPLHNHTNTNNNKSHYNINRIDENNKKQSEENYNSYDFTNSQPAENYNMYESPHNNYTLGNKPNTPPPSENSFLPHNIDNQNSQYAFSSNDYENLTPTSNDRQPTNMNNSHNIQNSTHQSINTQKKDYTHSHNTLTQNTHKSQHINQHKNQHVHNNNVMCNNNEQTELHNLREELKTQQKNSYNSQLHANNNVNHFNDLHHNYCADEAYTSTPGDKKVNNGTYDFNKIETLTNNLTDKQTKQMDISTQKLNQTLETQLQDTIIQYSSKWLESNLEKIATRVISEEVYKALSKKDLL